MQKYSREPKVYRPPEHHEFNKERDPYRIGKIIYEPGASEIPEVKCEVSDNFIRYISEDLHFFLLGDYLLEFCNKVWNRKPYYPLKSRLYLGFDPDDPGASFPALEFQYPDTEEFDIISLIDTFTREFGEFLVKHSSSREEFQKYIHFYREVRVYFERAEKEDGNNT